MNHKHKLLYSLAGLFMLAGLAVSPSVVAEDIEGAFAPGVITLDGQQTDWEGINTTYFKDEGVVVGLSNDTANLYVFFRFNNAEYVRTIHQTGLTLYLDARGKKKKDIAVRFYGGPGMQMPNDPRMQNMSEEQRERMAQRQNEQGDKFQFIDTKNVLNVIIDPSGANGPAVAVDTLQGFYQYEFCIPLHESVVRNYGIGASPGDKISIGIEWGNTEFSNRPEGEQPERGMGGGRGGGMGGGPPGGGMGGGRGGGMGGGPPGGMRGGQNEIEKQDIWIKTTLATQPSPEQK